MQMSTCTTRSYLFRFGTQLLCTLYKLATENSFKKKKSFQLCISLYCFIVANIKWQLCKKVATAVSSIIMPSTDYTTSKNL